MINSDYSSFCFLIIRKCVCVCHSVLVHHEDRCAARAPHRYCLTLKLKLVRSKLLLPVFSPFISMFLFVLALSSFTRTALPVEALWGRFTRIPNKWCFVGEHVAGDRLSVCAQIAAGATWQRQQYLDESFVCVAVFFYFPWRVRTKSRAASGRIE